MPPFDRVYNFLLTFNCKIALSRVIFKIFSIEKYRDLEISFNGQSRSLKVVPFDRLGMVFY